MTNYSLNERQKNLLRSIAPYLGDRSAKNYWEGISVDGRTGKLLGWDRFLPSELHEEWSDVNIADIKDFVECGFFRAFGPTAFTLHAQKIIDAVKDEFGETDQPTIPRVTNTPNQLIIEPLFGAPAISSQFKCDVFMVMPFRPKLDDIYKNIIKPVAEELNLIIKRGDDFSSQQGVIMTEIWSAINACRLVIAECTAIDGEINGDVYYELGIADTLGKPAILVTQNIDNIPFDLRHRRLTVYENTILGGRNLYDKLKTTIIRMLNDLDENEPGE